MSKKMRAVILIGGIAAIFVVVWLLSGNVSKGKAIEVTVDTVKRGNITQLVSGSGKIQPEVQVNISAHVAGKIIDLPVQEGETVKKGQLLVRLERQQYEALAERARSTLKAAKANFKKANADYSRMQQLYKENLCSMSELESSEATLMFAESEVEQANASLSQAEDNLSKTTITSPIGGTIALLNKEEGEIALGSQFQADVIMVVADLTKMEVVAEIDENDVVNIEVGEMSRIEVDAVPDTVLRGRVSEIAHTATTRGRGTQEEITNFEVKIAILNRMPQLRPGMSATVEIETETHEDVLYVPIQSITMRIPENPVADLPQSTTDWRQKKGDTRDESADAYGPGGRGQTVEEEEKPSEKTEKVEVVFVVEEGTAKMRPIATGLTSETDIEILNGVNEGEIIVIGSYRVLSKELQNEDLVKETSKKSETDNANENER